MHSNEELRTGGEKISYMAIMLGKRIWLSSSLLIILNLHTEMWFIFLRCLPCTFQNIKKRGGRIFSPLPTTHLQWKAVYHETLDIDNLEKKVLMSIVFVWRRKVKKEWNFCISIFWKGSYQGFLVSYRMFMWKGYVFEEVFGKWKCADRMLVYTIKDWLFLIQLEFHPVPM